MRCLSWGVADSDQQSTRSAGALRQTSDGSVRGTAGRAGQDLLCHRELVRAQLS